MSAFSNFDYYKEVKKIYAAKGIRGMYCALPMQGLSEMPSYAAQFWSYETLKKQNKFINDLNISQYSKDALQLLWTGNAGGIAGAISGMVIIP